MKKWLNVFEYRKKIDGTVVYVEEARTGKRTLTTKTMWNLKDKGWEMRRDTCKL
jgi:hypothetical protein